MATHQPPDDIKIIAQFLAGRMGKRDWQELTRDAARLRRQLKERGGFRMVRIEGAPKKP